MTKRMPRFLIISVGIFLGLLGVATAYGNSLMNSAQGSANAFSPLPCQVGSQVLVPCMPSNYKEKQTEFLIDPIQASKAQADQDIANYLGNAKNRNDKDFIAYVVEKIGAPPAGTDQTSELDLLHRIGKSRSKSGLKTSAWLELHGGKDIWNWYKNELILSESKKSKAKLLKKEMSLTESLSNAIVKQAKVKYARVSPYQVDPTLNAQNQKKFAGKTKFSYPSSHSVIAAAQVDILKDNKPALATNLEKLELQIDFSRMYTGGHYESDVIRGVYAGQLIGDYAKYWIGG